MRKSIPREIAVRRHLMGYTASSSLFTSTINLFSPLFRLLKGISCPEWLEELENTIERRFDGDEYRVPSAQPTTLERVLALPAEIAGYECLLSRGNLGTRILQVGCRVLRTSYSNSI